MNKQRIAAYLNLIQELLSCPNGEEAEILSRSSELVDEGLVIMCQQVAEMLRGQGQENQAGFLINLAEQLAEYLNMARDGGERAENPSNNSLDDYQKFLQQLIQIEIDSNFDHNGTSRNKKTEYPSFIYCSGILSPIPSGYKPGGPPTTQILFLEILSVL